MSTLSKRGRSPPPGLSWKDIKLPNGKPVHKKTRVLSTASRASAPCATASSSTDKPAEHHKDQDANKDANK